MAHRWEALIDFPWGGHCLRTTSRSVDILVHGAAESRDVFVCVMLEKRSNKRPTEEKVGCVAHSVWDVNEYVFYSGWSGRLPCIAVLRRELQREI